MIDWKKEIAVMALVKSELARADAGKLWPYHLPRVAATQAQILTAESCLGTNSFSRPLCARNGQLGER
jgi:hypothetical protein